MKRAISVTQLIQTKKKTLELSREFAAVFGSPEYRGVWFIAGNTGNGKTRFLLQLIKELSRFDKVVMNSLEEADSLTIKEAFIREQMQEVARRVILVPAEPIDEFSHRLSLKKSPKIAVIDSVQYVDFNFKEYLEFKKEHRDKLIIFTSQVEGKLPIGRTAQRIRYDADLKIWVEGYRAFSLGRYRGPEPFYTIWAEGANNYWGDTLEK